MALGRVCRYARAAVVLAMAGIRIYACINIIIIISFV